MSRKHSQRPPREVRTHYLIPFLRAISLPCSLIDNKLFAIPIRLSSLNSFSFSAKLCKPILTKPQHSQGISGVDHVDIRPDFLFRGKLIAAKPVPSRNKVAGSGTVEELCCVIDPERPVLSKAYPRQKLRESYAVKARPLIETKQRAHLGGAGGIRTHEWRFCRPLPWATWVPRRNFKYSENLHECQGITGQSKA
jgi:hypothetical protein